MQPDEWRRTHPECFYLTPAEPVAVESYLRDARLLAPDEGVIRAERAGDGNMNCTVRVTTSDRSFIVKQARPWVEKYPQFDAPWDRALREMEFYEMVRECPAVATAMPRLIFADPAQRLIILEDVGVGTDYTGIYRGDTLPDSDVAALGRYLSALHRSFSGVTNRRGLANRDMRELNSQHIFFIPLERDNRLDLDALCPGLAAAAAALINHAGYVRAVHTLAEAYLLDGPHLLHGDFFPGSFLKTPSGPRIIDPEFAFFGRSEFDPAVLIAHLLLGRQSPECIVGFLSAYRPPSDHDESLMIRLAGVEIMRRLIGYAQLPLGYGLGKREHLLEISRQMVLEPDRKLLAVRHP